jgi:hypothetical protein
MSIKQEDREDRVRRHAYRLWLDAGLPPSGSIEFWQAAEEQEVAEKAKIHSHSAESFPAEDPERPAQRLGLVASA